MQYFRKVVLTSGPPSSLSRFELAAFANRANSRLTGRDLASLAEASCKPVPAYDFDIWYSRCDVQS